MNSGRPPTCVTSTTLLEGLRDPANRTIWTGFVERYRPLVLGYVSRLAVPCDDAEDVAQSALMAFTVAYRDGRYDRARGRLSSWLFGIVKLEVQSYRRRLLRHDERGLQEGAALEALPSEDQLEALWEERWREAILQACLNQVRQEIQPKTMAAFEAFALEERPAQDVARDLGMTANAVFGAKRRVLERVRELMPLMQDSW